MLLHTRTESSATLLEGLQELAQREGANLMGVAPVERFEGAPRGHHPRDFVPRAQSVVVFGAALVSALVDHQAFLSRIQEYDEQARKTVGQNWFYTATSSEIPGQVLELTAYRATTFLLSSGYKSVFFPATYSLLYLDMREHMEAALFAPFSHRHAAVRAGLAEFGLLNLVVTPQFGPRCRFISVITEAALPPSPLLERKTCLGISCSLCIDSCPGNALTPMSDTREGEILLDPVSRTDKHACMRSHRDNGCKGVCLAACPVGDSGW